MLPYLTLGIFITQCIIINKDIKLRLKHDIKLLLKMYIYCIINKTIEGKENLRNFYINIKLFLFIDIIKYFT